ncbi:MAG: transposase [Mycobacteriales bacterium]
MDPTKVFCDNPDCPARGKVGEGNIKVHSHKEERYRCTACKKTFAASKGTPFYRLHHDPALFAIVTTLLSEGCPPQAVVAAYGLDERTVADWHHKAGSHGQDVHQHFLETRPLDLGHVQADELYAKCVGFVCWVAMAIAVPSRLWLGGVISTERNLSLIQRLVNIVRLAWLPGTTLLICVDGLSSYVTAFWRAFREKELTGRPGRPPFRLPERVWLAQVIKKCSGRRLKEVIRRVVWGSLEKILEQLRKTATGKQINTSYIERLNGTFRSCLAWLTRRGRRLVHRQETLEKGMYLVGCVYNFCKEHRSLRVRQEQGKKWRHRTPAMAAGWADHVWSVHELLSFRPPLLLHA